MKLASCALRAIVLASMWCLTGSLLRAEPPRPATAAFGEIANPDGGAAIFNAPAAGRYSITAKAPNAVRIELVDMIAGPIGSAISGLSRDARVDALLDKGAYKLRVGKTKDASAAARLFATPFLELNPQPPTLAPGRPQTGELGDLRQRTYAVDVGADGQVAIEAAGRALADLRLWRDTGELVDLSPDRRNVETKPGHAMTRLRLSGLTAPGRYLLTAYGGEPQVWPEGDAAQPFMLRIATSAPLDAGLFEGVIGPFGVARFTAPPAYDAFRLSLPLPAPTRLAVRRSRNATQAAIGKANRDPFTVAVLPSEGGEPAEIEVSGYEGQVFSLRAAHQAARLSFEGSGPHLVGVDLAGEGGDEIPATALFAKLDREGKAQILAADAPRVANGRPWRGKFNLRGLASLLFEMKDAGPIAIDAKGVKLRATIEPALGALAPRADGDTPKRHDLSPGFYKLVLEPLGDAAGVVDVTLAAPGLAAGEPERTPSRAAISFGVQQLEADGSYLILGNVAPDMLFGPRITPLPADLEKAPLPIWQGANETIAIPLRRPKEGAVIAVDSRGADVPYALGPSSTLNDATIATATIAPNGQARAIGFSFAPEPASAAPESDGAEPKDAGEAKSAKPRAHPPMNLAGDRPVFFDLRKDETQELRLDLAGPGLYRAESLGRLKTAVKLGARVATDLGSGEDNGPGHNGLVTGFLRAGAYRATVTAKDSSGRLGFAVKKVALETTPTLRGGDVARARLDPGAGAAIPIEIAEDGVYVMDITGVGRIFTARLEDAEGWPIETPGPMRSYAHRLEKGLYRLVVLPQDVEARLVARLRREKAAPALAGHGPHDLPFDEPQKLEWREPAAAGAAREPDVWRFALIGDSEVQLDVGEGMLAELFRGETSLGKFAAGHDFKAKLGAGDYRVEARALAADDRLDYTISLRSKELQPGAARRVALPARLGFALGQERVIDLSSLGDREMLATLKDASGAVIEQSAGGARDWNLGLSRRLPAGAYTLELAPLGVQAQPPVPEESGEEGAAPESAGEQAIDVSLSALPEVDDGPLAAKGARKLIGASAHVLSPPKAAPDGLALVGATSSREIALALERRGADGRWRTTSLRRGLAPFVAWGAVARDSQDYRILVWPVGGGEAEIEIGAQTIARDGDRVGRIRLAPAEGLPAALCVGAMDLPSASVVELTAPPPGLALGSSPDAALMDAQAGALAPQSNRLWMVAPGDCTRSVDVRSLAWNGEPITLSLGDGETARLPPLSPPSGKMRLWLARAEQGQVGLDAGAGMAVSADATLALAGAEPLRVWNASGSGPLRVSLNVIDLDVAPRVRADASFRATMPGQTALPVALAKDGAPRHFELPAGTAMFARAEPQPLALFAGAESLSVEWAGALPTDAQLLFVNLGEAVAPIAFGEDRNSVAGLSLKTPLNRFFDARGEIVLPLGAAKGDVLFGLGADAQFVGADGHISRRAHWDRRQSDDAGLPLDGPGLVMFDHPAGLSALWLEKPADTPWTRATPKPLAPPQHVELSGEAQAFALRLDAPALLSMISGAPAIGIVTQNDARTVKSFPEGLALRRYLAAGDARVDLHSPEAGALRGALDIRLEPVISAHEGLNEPVTIAPGGVALFGFDVKSEAEVGIGLRSEPDVASLRLLAADGAVLGEGLAQLRRLAPGRYVAEARAPREAPLAVLRLALRGLTPPPANPPDEVVADLLDKAGLKKTKAR